MRAKTTHTGVSNKTETEYTYSALRHHASIIFVNEKERDNTRDWLIHINHHNLAQSAPSQDNNDRFGINIGYDDQQNNGLSGTPIGLMLGADPYYNGNVSWVMYRIHGVEHHMWGFPTERVGYVYRYDAAVRHPASIIDFNKKERDKANRLTRGEFAGELYGEWFGGNAYNERDITYHKSGNLTGLKRYDQNGTVLHDYSYVYYNNTNRLRRVTGSGNNYTYDNNGNMIQDLANGIGFVIYDIHNLPVRVFTTDGSPWDYAYDHEGNRVRTYNGVKTNYYINGIDGRTEVVTDKASAWATYNLYGLDLIGQIRRSDTTWNRFYFLKDHLGSVRVIVDASGNVVAYDDYYPFGLQMPGRTQDSSAVDGRYKFTGKERDAETKYDYFGARYYDARIGRWLQVDPMAEKYIGISPYQYSFNNPVRYYDPDGKFVVESKRGGVIAHRYTKSEYRTAQVFEFLPVLSTASLINRTLRGDPSFSPGLGTWLIHGASVGTGLGLGYLTKFIEKPVERAIMKFIAKRSEAIVSIPTIELEKGSKEKIERDKAVFETALTTEIEEGIPLAVPAQFITTHYYGRGEREGYYAPDEEAGNGVPTLIMLNPVLEEKWGERALEEFRSRLIEIWESMQ